MKKKVILSVVFLATMLMAKAQSNRTFEVNGVSFAMIYVEGGTFTMGATPEQGSDASGDEKPAHSVTLSSYCIGQTEVTQCLWEAVMGNNPSTVKDDSRPVDNISWKDCEKFINKLNKLTKQKFRLPTEAEWEFAARGGTQSRGYKYSGSNTLNEVGWYIDNNIAYLHAVGTKSYNELGIYDMSGNVCEWCQDWFDEYEETSQTNPQGPSSSSDSEKIFRGGSSSDNSKACRVTHRDGNRPSFKSEGLGLRLVL